MHPIIRALRVYTDSNKLGLTNEAARQFIIHRTGEKPGKDWMKRVRAYAATHPKEA